MIASLAARLLVLFVVGSVLAVSPGPNLAKSVLLADAVDSLGARCLDGSPQRIWIQEATSAVNASKWYVHLMGGGWCTSMASCTARAYSPSQCYRGSSNVSCFNNNTLSTRRWTSATSHASTARAGAAGC